MITSEKVITGTFIGGFIFLLGTYGYHLHKVREFKQQEIQLKAKEVENQKLYFEKLTPEQVERIETEKLEVKKAELELEKTEAELKKTVADFKAEIHDDIETKVMNTIHDDIRETFDNWSTKFENRLENKIDNVVTRIDNLSDKYGGVKEANGSAGPSINVVNAPNN